MEGNPYCKFHLTGGYHLVILKNLRFESVLWVISRPNINYVLFYFVYFLIFCWTEVHLWSHWLLLFWTSCDLPRGFQIQSGSLTCTLTCLRAVIPKVTSGATPAFSANRGVHYTCVYSRLPGTFSDLHRSRTPNALVSWSARRDCKSNALLAEPLRPGHNLYYNVINATSNTDYYILRKWHK